VEGKHTVLVRGTCAPLYLISLIIPIAVQLFISIGMELWGQSVSAMTGSLWKWRNRTIFSRNKKEQTMLWNTTNWRVTLWSKGWKEAHSSIPGNV